MFLSSCPVYWSLERFTQSKRFIFVNHTRTPENEPYHGRAVRLYSGDTRVPFYGSFLDHEMRVRGRYPYVPEFEDRPIKLPFEWQSWITDAPHGRDDGDGTSGGGGKDGNSSEGGDGGSDDDAR